MQNSQWLHLKHNLGGAIGNVNKVLEAELQREHVKSLSAQGHKSTPRETVRYYRSRETDAWTGDGLQIMCKSSGVRWECMSLSALSKWMLLDPLGCASLERIYISAPKINYILITSSLCSYCNWEDGQRRVAKKLTGARRIWLIRKITRRCWGWWREGWNIIHYKYSKNKNMKRDYSRQKERETWEVCNKCEEEHSWQWDVLCCVCRTSEGHLTNSVS